MSDELIEGHALRGRRRVSESPSQLKPDSADTDVLSEVFSESGPPSSLEEKALPDMASEASQPGEQPVPEPERDLAVDEESERPFVTLAPPVPDEEPPVPEDLPHIVLEPPPEAGDILRRMQTQTTRPVGLPPVGIEPEDGEPHGPTAEAPRVTDHLSVVAAERDSEEQPELAEDAPSPEPDLPPEPPSRRLQFNLPPVVIDQPDIDDTPLSMIGLSVNLEPDTPVEEAKPSPPLESLTPAVPFTPFSPEVEREAGPPAEQEPATSQEEAEPSPPLESLTPAVPFTPFTLEVEREAEPFAEQEPATPREEAKPSPPLESLTPAVPFTPFSPEVEEPPIAAEESLPSAIEPPAEDAALEPELPTPPELPHIMVEWPTPLEMPAAEVETRPSPPPVTLPTRPTERPSEDDLAVPQADVIAPEWVLELRQPEPEDDTGALPRVRVRARHVRLAAILLVALAILLIFVPRSPLVGQPGSDSAPFDLSEVDVVTTPAAPDAPTPALPGEQASPSGGAVATSTPLPSFMTGRVAFASALDGDFEIYVLDVASGTLSQLTDNDAQDRWPAWSPDGSRIVFTSDRSGDDDLFVMSIEGGDQVQLTTNEAADRAPEWSPDGLRIIFSRETAAGASLLAFDVGCMAEPGACEDGLIRITADTADFFPAYSPDGSRLAFDSAQYPGLPSRIIVVDVTGEDYTTLEGSGTSDFFPVWSPDGTHILFVSNAFGDYDLWLMGVDGENLIQITQNVGFDVEPDWIPGGPYIVFASIRGGDEDFELYIMRTDCASPDDGCEDDLIQLTDNDVDDINPAWTP